MIKAKKDRISKNLTTYARTKNKQTFENLTEPLLV